MRRLTKSHFLIFAAGAFFSAALYSNPVSGAGNTEKIKIVSAFCIDGEWSFNIFDGLSGKTFPSKIGIKNGAGMLIQSFDEDTQTALIQTDHGVFNVGMKEREETQFPTPQATPVAAPAPTTANNRQSLYIKNSKDPISNSGTPEKSGQAAPPSDSNIPSTESAEQISFSNGGADGESDRSSASPPSENNALQARGDRVNQQASSNQDSGKIAESPQGQASDTSAQSQVSEGKTSSSMTRRQLLKLIQKSQSAK